MSSIEDIIREAESLNVSPQPSHIFENVTINIAPRKVRVIRNPHTLTQSPAKHVPSSPAVLSTTKQPHPPSTPRTGLGKRKTVPLKILEREKEQDSSPVSDGATSIGNRSPTTVAPDPITLFTEHNKRLGLEVHKKPEVDTWPSLQTNSTTGSQSSLMTRMKELIAKMIARPDWESKQRLCDECFDVFIKKFTHYSHVLQHIKDFYTSYIKHLHNSNTKMDRERIAEERANAVEDLVARYEKELAEKRTKIKTLKEALAQSEAAKTNTKTSLLAEVNAYQQECDRVKATSADEHQKLKEANNLICILEEQTRMCSGQISDLERRADKEAELQQHNKELLHDSEVTRERLLQTEAKMIKEKERLQKSVHELKMDLAMNKVTSRSIRVKNKKLVQENEELHTMVNTLDTELTELQSKMAELRITMTPRPEWPAIDEDLSYVGISLGTLGGTQDRVGNVTETLKHTYEELNDSTTKLSKAMKVMSHMENELVDLWSNQEHSSHFNPLGGSVEVPKFLRTTSANLINHFWTRRHTTKRIHELMEFLNANRMDYTQNTGRGVKGGFEDGVYAFLASYHVGTPHEKLCEQGYNLVNSVERYAHVEPLCRLFLLVYHGELPVEVYTVQTFILHSLLAHFRKHDTQNHGLITKKAFSAVIRHFFQHKQKQYIQAKFAAMREHRGSFSPSLINYRNLFVEREGYSTMFVKVIRRIVTEEMLEFYSRLEDAVANVSETSRNDPKLVLASLKVAEEAVMEMVTSPEEEEDEDADDSRAHHESSSNILSVSLTRKQSNLTGDWKRRQSRAALEKANMETRKAKDARLYRNVLVDYQPKEDGMRYIKILYPKHVASIQAMFEKAQHNLPRYPVDHAYGRSKWLRKYNDETRNADSDIVELDALLWNLRRILARPEEIMGDKWKDPKMRANSTTSTGKPAGA